MKKIIRVLPFIIAIFVTVMVTHAYYSTTKTLPSIFKTDGYAFKLNAGGGTFSSSDKVVVSNGKTTLPTPTRNGYTFLGYKVNDNVYSTSNKTFTVTNAGNYVSRPCITILGTGTCSVSVNGNKIFDVSELPITIDSLSFESYYEGVNKNRKKTGGYIELNPGSSKIEVTGDNVSNITMRRCDRWL